ncbi:HK97-gp10 family putative phage morphogenesis protein [Comamonas sp.]|uniref:HK97-gp10 family putative phage morphogenesis protein n=1 Tax=Comamonas sp. TaxID=34028 RepID=UPI0025903BA2|nr:HK97-gp10 family putative phage morphogenesis protein [Comamonas sp.]
MAGKFSVRLDARGLHVRLDQMARAVSAAARPAAQAGAQVFYEQVRANVPVSLKAHYFYGRNSRKTGVRYYFEPGTLRDAIYQVFAPERSGDGYAHYVVSWNHLKAPYGAMVEYGTSRAPAYSFVRAARGQADERAKAAMLGQLKQDMQGVL